MTQIEPAYATFEQAKLLKEKGFRVSTKNAWDSHGKNKIIESSMKDELDWNKLDKGAYYAAPEQWQIVEWLRVEKGIWIQVSISKYGVFYCNILQNQPTKSIDIPMTYEMICQLNDFNSPQEAYSAAFDYILNELI